MDVNVLRGGGNKWREKVSHHPGTESQRTSTA